MTTSEAFVAQAEPESDLTKEIERLANEMFAGPPLDAMFHHAPA